MRIGITCYPTYGGSGVVATELGMELAARGHDVHFISYAPPIRMNPNDPHIHFHEVEVATYPLFDHPPYTLALATKMLEVFESESLDLLHVHYAIPHSVSAMLARSMAAPRRLPFITTLHGTDITLVGSNRSYLPITRFSIEQSDGVTAISQYLLNQTIKDFDIKRPIEVIPNFVNCDLYNRAADKASARAMGAQRRAHPHASFQFSPRLRGGARTCVECLALVRAESPRNSSRCAAREMALLCLCARAAMLFFFFFFMSLLLGSVASCSSSMDVVTPEEAKIAEEAGACAVMALERVPADIRRDGGVARDVRPGDDQGDPGGGERSR